MIEIQCLLRPKGPGLQLRMCSALSFCCVTDVHLPLPAPLQKHSVCNWKAISNNPFLHFDNHSLVDIQNCQSLLHVLYKFCLLTTSSLASVLTAQMCIRIILKMQRPTFLPNSPPPCNQFSNTFLISTRQLDISHTTLALCCCVCCHL